MKAFNGLIFINRFKENSSDTIVSFFELEYEEKLYIIHPLIRIPKEPGTLFELANIRDIKSQEQVKNFDNAVESLLFKTLFYKLWK